MDSRALRVVATKATVVANESYELFVSALQAEMEEAFGNDGAAPRPTNARQKRIAKRKPLDALPEEFVNLWEKIKLKTRYQVSVESERLIADVLGALDKLKIDPPRIVASKAEITADVEEDRLDYQHYGQRVVATLAGRQGVPNIVNMIEDLIAHITPAIKLTRRKANFVTSTTTLVRSSGDPSRYVEKLIQHINRKDWWHVPPRDIRAYQKRGKFFASSFREAEFYGRPNDQPERVFIVSPLIGDNDGIERKLLGKVESHSEITVHRRLSLDAKLRRAALRMGFDSIVLLTAPALKALKKDGKIPRSVELNLLNLDCLRHG